MKKEFGPYGPNSVGTLVIPCFQPWTFGWTMTDHADDSPQRGV